MASAGVELLWMAGHDVPELMDTSAVRAATVHTPDAGLASLTLSLSAPMPELVPGMRTCVGVVFGIAPHVLIDARIRAVSPSELLATDVLADLREQRTDLPQDALNTQVSAMFAAMPLAGLTVVNHVPDDAPGVLHLPGESDADWLERALTPRGLFAVRLAGHTPLTNTVRIAPLAMERTKMPAFTPADCLTERRFSPALGVRVAELRVVASTEQRGLLRGVHSLSGFDADDGAYYAQDIVHHLSHTTYEQTLTLVKLP